MGIVEMSVQSMGEMGKDFLPNFIQPFLENNDRRSRNDGNQKLIPAFHNLHRKDRPFPLAAALTLEYLVGVPSRGECDIQVSPKSSPLQSLFLGEGDECQQSTLQLIFEFASIKPNVNHKQDPILPRTKHS